MWPIAKRFIFALHCAAAPETGHPFMIFHKKGGTSLYGWRCYGVALYRETVMMDQPKKSNRGFAAMDPEKQRAIARKGGESVPHHKRSFARNHKLAAMAGRKGGQSVAPQDRSFSRDHELAAAAGRKGGEASHINRVQNDESRPAS